MVSSFLWEKHKKISAGWWYLVICEERDDCDNNQEANMDNVTPAKSSKEQNRLLGLIVVMDFL